MCLGVINVIFLLLLYLNELKPSAEVFICKILKLINTCTAAEPTIFPPEGRRVTLLHRSCAE